MIAEQTILNWLEPENKSPREILELRICLSRKYAAYNLKSNGQSFPDAWNITLALDQSTTSVNN
jgi:hypothetical protein